MKKNKESEKIMTAKEYLMRSRRIEGRIRSLKEARTNAWTRATSTVTSQSSGGGRSSDVSRKLEAYALYTDKIDAAIAELYNVKTETIGAISRVKDNNLAELLMLYYVNGETWERVAAEMAYSYSHVVHVLHPRALAAMEDILRKDSTKANIKAC
ncbi:MAG: hypothetical protein IJP43_06115 [Oscillospiraceae bacterium]|nr:hypothetical protein [Oscillospiraceae bacterium]